MTKESTLVTDLEESREELAKLVVRDMKTPLVGLANLLEIADRSSVSHFKAEASQYVNEALGATETLEELVGFLLGVRRMISGKAEASRQACDLAALGKGVAEGLKEVAQIMGVSIVVTGDPGIVSCDLDQVTGLIRHLVRVGIKASSPGQQVDVRTEKHGDQIRFSVSVGSNIMRDQGGRDGLGLTYCRLVVESHGGRFEMEPGQGQWWFALPESERGAEGVAAVPVAVERAKRYLARQDQEDLQRKRRRRSIVSLGTRHQFAVAVALVSAIPLLAFGYLVFRSTMVDEVLDNFTVWLLLPSVVAMVGLGVVLLARHTIEMKRLREYLEMMSRGESPEVGLSDSSDDFTAIKKSLGAVIRQSDEKVRIIEAQSRALLQAEQQRVMAETVGAACHHLGQPATVIRGYLDLMKKVETSPEMKSMIQECQAAAEEVANILHRLQGVGQYQTEPYLVSSGPGARQEERILKI